MKALVCVWLAITGFSFAQTTPTGVKPGPLTLLCPEWIPGEHGPTGPVTDLVNLRISGGGTVPDGVSSIGDESQPDLLSAITAPHAK
jgi:hypothetical protein